MEYIQAWTLSAARDVRTKFRQEPIRHGPRIGYTAALASRFVWRGHTFTVESAPLRILRAWLSHYSARHPVYLAEALSCLDDGEDDVARWQAVDTALVYGVSLPLDVIV